MQRIPLPKRIIALWDGENSQFKKCYINPFIPEADSTDQ